jgi:predicted small secreted protein
MEKRMISLVLALLLLCLAVPGCSANNSMLGIVKNKQTYTANGNTKIYL